MTLDDRIKERKDRLSGMMDEKQAAAEELKQIESSMAKAVNKGAYDEYSAGDARKQYLEHRIKFLEEATSTFTIVDKEELSEAWREYLPQYKKQYEKAMKGYTAARKAFYKAFMDLMEVQDQGFKEREKLAGYLGKYAAPDGCTDGNIYFNEFPMPTLSSGNPERMDVRKLNKNIPDYLYFLLTNEISKADDEKVRAVSVLHRPMSCAAVMPNNYLVKP